MRVLVTGHAGYIGCVLTRMLLEQNHTVVGLDSDLYRRCTWIGELPPVPGVRRDMRDVEKSDVEGFDAVIHLAALSNDPLGNLNPELTYDINQRATTRLAELAKEAGVRRFLFSSSCSLYGAASPEDLLDESAQMNPVTPYGKTKMLVEDDLRQLADDNFSPTYMRNATAYGVSPRHRFDVVLNNLMAHAIASSKILLKSDGTPWRPLVHIEDISRAFVAALNADLSVVHDQAFNVGQTAENHRVIDLADIVADTVPGCAVEMQPGAGPDTRCYRVNCDKIQRELPAFQPKWTVVRGAAELHEAYMRRKIRVQDFEGDRFQRVAHIRRLLHDGVLDGSLRFVDNSNAAVA